MAAFFMALPEGNIKGVCDQENCTIKASEFATQEKIYRTWSVDNSYLDSRSAVGIFRK